MAHPDLDLARTLAANARGFLRDLPGQEDDRQLQTRYHRLAIALELALKSYLIVRGHTDDANRRIGHDLRRAAQVATAEGLAIAPALYDLVDDAHPFFMRGGFHREHRIDWQRHRADRAAAELAALLTTIAAPIGAR
ncbi:hypothetical protein GO308_17570 [Sphingomonas sp. SFZ2018-12]|uniref:hypothetical protein n=1 Tax=Sphingomonas sp. SFZ2018-12 TaxID=2683197 RepID=UPI001F0E7358|nr:hypothetical protein [Sphingomonas sp. SFZ2018-12]MCH4894916.1 hypothetical protein [Sphingomonas sp. SFZ2018-12]